MPTVKRTDADQVMIAAGGINEDDLLDQLERLGGWVGVFAQRFRQLRDELAATHGKHRVAMADRTFYYDRASALALERDEARKAHRLESAALFVELNRAKVECQALQVTLTHVKAQRGDLRGQLTAATIALSTVKSQRDELRAQLTAAIAERDTLAAQVAAPSSDTDSDSDRAKDGG